MSELHVTEKLLVPAHQWADAHAPFAWLGRRDDADGTSVRVLRPGCSQAWLLLVDGSAASMLAAANDVFTWRGNGRLLGAHYSVRAQHPDGSTETSVDAYTFAPECDANDLHYWAEGTHRHAWRFLGSHLCTRDGIDGATFRVWAPNARAVSVVGSWNRWEARAQPMQVLGDSGVWTLFVPGVAAGALYKYAIRDRAGHEHLKSDPFAQRFEGTRERASIVSRPTMHAFRDTDWMRARGTADWQHQPMAIYEVHVGSWRQGLSWRQLAPVLADYVRREGFTHVELLPLAEHPFYGSWGYQTTGYFAPTERYGDADDLRYLVDHLHANGIGVLLDWTPAHFPADAHALARFDGTALFEHEDARLGRHPDWDTLIFNYERREVVSFLVSSAIYWLQEFHFDGLRVDAVASMLYRDYSRQPDQWLPNRLGGRENLEAIDFLRALNIAAHAECAGAMVIAEESTAWPLVTRPPESGGLGFTMKWNMGFMHDALAYLGMDPVHRRYAHDKLTFGRLYAFSENFVLPFSHDEVVHGKGSLLARMPGDRWQQFANLRLLYALQYTWPGKKLLFMGCEFAQRQEWSHERSLDWHCLDDAAHRGIRDLVRALNHAYTSMTPLHDVDFDDAGFAWLDCEDRERSLLSFLRFDRGGRCVAVILNFTPVPREAYRLGVPVPGRWHEVVNTDSVAFGGSNVGNLGSVDAQPVAAMGHRQSLTLTLPPLAALVLAPLSRPT